MLSNDISLTDKSENSESNISESNDSSSLANTLSTDTPTNTSLAINNLSSNTDTSSVDTSDTLSLNDTLSDDYELDLADRWQQYDIDIYDYSTAIEKFRKLGFEIIENIVPCKCTFFETGEDYFVQKSYTCQTCFPKESNSICEYCITDCKNKDHKISNARITPSFCDKGANL